MLRSKGACLVGFAMMLVRAESARAQYAQTFEGFSQIQWNFVPPGARANAMGGAFVGVADDASAAVTNPAGMIALTRPQVYLEFSNSNLRVPHLSAADSLITGTPTYTGQNVAALSFVSVSAPIGSAVAVGFTANQFLNFQDAFQVAPRGFPGFSYLPASGVVDYRAWSYAGMVAVAVQPRFHLGVGVSVNHLDAQSTYTQFLPPPSGLTNSVISTNASSTAAAFTVGAVIRPTDTVSAGLVFSKGPSFSGTANGQQNLSIFVNVPLVELPLFPTSISFNVPNRLGAGVSARPVPRLLVAADVDRIGYSRLADGLLPSGLFPLVTPYISGSNFTYDDATEVHVGAEINAITGTHPLFVRGGAYTDPYHSLRATNAGPLDERLFNGLPQDTKVRGTIGLGTVLRSRVQVDAAFTSDRRFVASTSVRF